MSFVYKCWPKIAWLKWYTLYSKIFLHISEILEGILELDISPSMLQYRLYRYEYMIDSLGRDTPQGECRYNHIYRANIYHISDMSSAHLIYLTYCSILFLEFEYPLMIVFNNDESRMIRLIFYQIFCNLPVSCTELDDSMYILDTRERDNTTDKVWWWAKSVSYIRPEFSCPESDIHRV